MTQETILITVASSLLSGLIGIILSFWFYSRLERRKIKLETARKMFGNKHQINGHAFQEAMNEAMVVFSDSDNVIQCIENLFKVVETPLHARAKGAADEAQIKLMKAICKNINIKYKNLPDAYYLKFFSIQS